MAIQVNEVVYYANQSFNSLGEKTSGPGKFVGVQGVVFYLYSKDQDGYYRIEMRTIAGDYRQIAEGTVSADELEIINITFPLKEARVVFSPVAIPVEFSAEALGYPIVLTRDKFGNIGC